MAVVDVEEGRRLRFCIVRGRASPHLDVPKGAPIKNQAEGIEVDISSRAFQAPGTTQLSYSLSYPMGQIRFVKGLSVNIVVL